jgi:hypothetical protein
VHDIADLCINKCRLSSVANYLCELINLDVYYLYSRGHLRETSFLLPWNNGSGLPAQGRGCGSDAQLQLESRHECTQEPGSRGQGWTAAGLLPGMAEPRSSRAHRRRAGRAILEQVGPRAGNASRSRKGARQGGRSRGRGHGRGLGRAHRSLWAR